MQRIGDVQMECELCGQVTRLDDCEPCVGDGTEFGCPMPDCGGICEAIDDQRDMKEVPNGK